MREAATLDTGKAFSDGRRVTSVIPVATDGTIEVRDGAIGTNNPAGRIVRPAVQWTMSEASCLATIR